MYSFEGDFRRRPNQSFGGASKKEKLDDLLQRAVVERQKRGDYRHRLNSAITVQAFIRGSLVRIKQKQQERLSFDNLKTQIQKDLSCLSEANLRLLLQKLIYFYKEDEDSVRLVWIAQTILGIIDQIIIWLKARKDLWLFKIMKLQEICLNHSRICARKKSSVAVPLRILEVFLCQKTYVKCFSLEESADIIRHIIVFIVKQDFFRNIRILFDELVPSSIEHSVTASTPMADTLLEFLLLPFYQMKDVPNECDRVTIMCKFSTAFLSPAFTAQVSEFILPYLAKRESNFPFDHFVKLLCKEKMNFDQGDNIELRIEPTPWLLYSVIVLASSRTDDMSGSAIFSYLQLLKLLIPVLKIYKSSALTSSSTSDDEDENIMDSCSEEPYTDDIQPVLNKAVDLINEPSHVQLLLATTDQRAGQENLMALCHLCDSLLTCHKMAIYKYRLLHTLAFRPTFLQYLWHTINSLSTSSILGTSLPIIQLLSRGIPLAYRDRGLLVPLLSLFSSLLGYLLQTLHDSEFYGEEDGVMPFSLSELAEMGLCLRDICLGLIELAYPNSRPVVTDNYIQAMLSIGKPNVATTDDDYEQQYVHVWINLFKVMTKLVNQLHSRDARRAFCPHDHWIAKNVSIPIHKPSDLQLQNRSHRSRLRLPAMRNLSRDQFQEEGPPVSTTKIKNITILRELPFIVPFYDRVLVFQQLIIKDKSEHQGDVTNFLTGPHIQIMIRRNYIYEDAFDKLSPENESNLKLKMRVQLVNFVGLDEAGIDGGGICREFISELLLTAFNPNRGFFILTHDNLLYPNPNVHLLVDNFPQHYYFIGRILGKAIYENMLVELPFASFFLSKLLARHSSNVDIDHLNSLDPVLYRNLLSLKKYDGNVTDLGLDFTLVVDELGETRVEELEAGGAKVAVTEANKIRYIHLMADYKLNKQIHAQCMAFKQGLFNVLDPEWLQLFDWKELQVLISGALIPIDIEDLRQHTNYAGNYTIDHPVIELFWKVVAMFNDKQKRQLLKFVTSCSRPPLLGFKDLYPAFCIQSAGTDDRLPTSSTCMNLLKLPEFNNEDTMRSKLLYAVESGCGFELS